MVRLLLLPLLLLSVVSMAQTTLQGHVTDEEQNGIPYAKIILRSLPDSNLIKTGVADESGNFSIIYTPIEGNLLLEVAAFGYRSKLTLANAITVEAIVLEPDVHQLNTVSVVASKPLLEHKPDRIIFNVSSSVSAIGSDAFELLKKAPGVRVNENNGVSITGKSTVSIMIDNKLQRVTGAELADILRSMSADNIEKIEVITTPPARYEAQGNAGIINIVTKRSAGNGINGNIGLSYQQRTRGSQRINEQLDYRKGKLNIYSSGNTSGYDFQSEQKTDVPYGNILQKQTLNQRSRPIYHRYRLGADFNISDKSVIGILYTLSSRYRETDQQYRAPVISTGTGVVDSIQTTNAIDKEIASGHTINVNYEWRIDSTGKKLNIDADYFTRSTNQDRDFTSLSYFSDGPSIGVMAYNQSVTLQKFNIGSVNADVALPYSFAELSFGAKVSFIQTGSDNRFYYLQNDVYLTDYNRTNKFDYTENTQAAYISASKTLNKWQAQFGLRLENTQIKGISLPQSNTVDKNYLLLFPTVYLQYSLNENNIFNINYARRVGRPSFEELNPFKIYGAGNSYKAGNPFLQPSFYHTAELSYSYKSRYIFSAYTGIVNNIHALISKVDTTNNTFYFINDNAGTSINIGVSVILVLNPLKWWECNMQAQGYYDKVNSNYYNASASVNGVNAFQASANNTFTFNNSQTLLGELGFNYVSQFQYDFVIHGAYYQLNAAIKARFLDKRLDVGISASDILRTEIYTFTNIYNDVYQYHYYDARNVSISLNWKFGNKKLKAHRQRQIDTEEIKRTE